jgi:uncharacterized protein involved in tolerance to divalent cations
MRNSNSNYKFKLKLKHPLETTIIIESTNRQFEHLKKKTKLKHQNL